MNMKNIIKNIKSLVSVFVNRNNDTIVIKKDGVMFSVADKNKNFIVSFPVEDGNGYEDGLYFFHAKEFKAILSQDLFENIGEYNTICWNVGLEDSSYGYIFNWKKHYAEKKKEFSETVRYNTFKRVFTGFFNDYRDITQYMYKFDGKYIGCDGHFLLGAEAEAENNGSEKHDYALYQDVATAISKLKHDVTVTMFEGKNLLIETEADGAEIVLFSDKVLDSLQTTKTSIQGIFPKHENMSFTVNRKEFLEALKALHPTNVSKAIVFDYYHETKDIRMSDIIRKNRLVNTQIVKPSGITEAKKESDVKIVVDRDYLKEIVKNLNGDQIEIGFEYWNNKESAIVIGSQTDGFIGKVMLIINTDFE